MSKKEFEPGNFWVRRLDLLKKARLNHEELAYMIPVANELVMSTSKRLHEAITGFEDRPHVAFHRHELKSARWYYDQVNQLWRESPVAKIKRPIIRMPMVVAGKKAMKGLNRGIKKERG